MHMIHLDIFYVARFGSNNEKHKCSHKDLNFVALDVMLKHFQDCIQLGTIFLELEIIQLMCLQILYIKGNWSKMLFVIILY